MPLPRRATVARICAGRSGRTIASWVTRRCLASQLSVAGDYLIACRIPGYGGRCMNDMVNVHDNAGPAERRRIRTGAFTSPTSGLAPGNVQANLVVLPRNLAHDFLRFAQSDPRPCPVLAVSEGIGR